MDVCPRVPSLVSDLLNKLSEGDYPDKLSHLELSEGRQKVLVDVLSGKIHLDHFDKLDIQLYVWKSLFSEVEPQCFISQHLYSKGSLCGYDPAKNGQNIIKHGVSFGEVVSYSSQFGTLLVPCPDEVDGNRFVVFSDLNPGHEGINLALPNNSLGLKDRLYTLSIVSSVGSRFRFISSRIMSKKRFAKSMKNAFRGIYDDSPEKKKDFVDACVSVLKRDLFKKS